MKELLSQGAMQKLFSKLEQRVTQSYQKGLDERLKVQLKHRRQKLINARVNRTLTAVKELFDMQQR